ncbi:histidine phosphatase superfamily branch 1 protein [Nitzschia inconspicua]|uniref:Histidine phosphatase superfamily branch 1 protein n=1 Tax=Nitzschia inconspicua TaxID=303405 RepID=A0A9K3PEF1_9STRA|nr:histidine phosphatase superfamily branch 1 protein [Nitzschia inconspicua]
MDTRLRERYFGEWDLHSDQHYHDVWKDDATDPSHTVKNVESVWGVTDRATRCVLSWDATLQNHWIVCVAHGDVLQILQTAFSKMDPSQHRSLEHLETATLRPLKLAK